MLACSSPSGAVAVGFSTAAAEGVEGAGQERFAGEEGFEEFLDLLLDGAEFGAERAEVVRHGWVSNEAR